MFAKVIAYQNYARQVSALAALICLFSIVLYGVFLLLAVEKAAAQQKYEGEARSISASLAGLESQYLAESSAMTPQKAQEMGLVAVPASRVAYEQITAPTFSLR